MKILFFCEAATFAHIVRSLLLAKSLENAETCIASNSFPEVLSNELKGINCLKLQQIVSSSAFNRALYQGILPYNEKIYESYIEEDCKIIETVKPDVVVGDFRLTLPISCHLKKVPLVSLANVIWSPFNNQKLEVPENNIVKFIGPSIAKLVFNSFSRTFFSKIINPINKLNIKYGVCPYESIYDLYTRGDYTVYLDAEGFIEPITLPEQHRIIGPVMYSTPAALPSWFKDLDDHLPNIFVSLGSSGDVTKLQSIVDGLSNLSARIIVATGGRTKLNVQSNNVYFEDYLPMKDIVEHCHVVINNGGSLMNYIALDAGVPIIGIPFNLDQYQSMACVESLGAGVTIRSGYVNEKNIFETAQMVLSDQQYKQKAESFSKKIKQKNPYAEFSKLLSEIIASKRPAARRYLLDQQRKGCQE